MVVIPRYTRGDVIRLAFIAIGILGAIAVLVVLGMKHIKKTSGRLPITGVILSHEKTGVKETELDVSRRGVKKEIVESGFYLRVQVPGEKETRKVMVDEPTWNAKKDGDTITFKLPEEERRF